MLFCCSSFRLWSTIRVDVNACENRGDQNRRQNPLGGRTQKLFSSRGWVAFIDPVRTEIVGNVENLHVGEARRLQGIEGGLHVRAMIPRAATAVENDGS